MFSFALFALFSGAAIAAPVHIAPEDTAGLRLIKTSSENEGQWMTWEQIVQLGRDNAPFMDITDHRDLHVAAAPSRTVQFPTGLHTAEMNKYFTQVNTGSLEDLLTTLSQDFHNRFYTSDSGVASSEWIHAKATEFAQGRSDISIEFFDHSGWPQKSVIARVEGSSGVEDTVVLGAHQDSVNWYHFDPENARSPGADDNGSGSVTLLEAFRVLVDGGFSPSVPVEFHWYAAEEVGLYGSQAIANDYKENGRAIVGMFNVDMTGYTEDGLPLRVIADNTDPELTAFVSSLIDEYSIMEYKEHSCGYGCSDHASFDRAGYAASSVFEPRTNPKIHSQDDDLHLIDFDLMEQFVRICISFAGELGYSA